MIHFRMMVVAVLALAGGCATPLEVASITEIQSKTGSRGIDVLEPKRQGGAAASVPEFAGDQLVEVRTYANKEGSGQVEISGATCSLSAADYNATLTSPGKVRVPLYRGQSSTLAVGCEMPGYKKKLVTVSPSDVTREKRYANGGSGGLVGLVAVSAIDAFSDNSKNEWRYPLAKILFEPEEPVRSASGSR